MAWLTKGCSVDGQLEEQTFDQSSSPEQRDCRWDEAQPAAASDRPSSRVKMWVWMICS
ncbi:hypothetical protein HanIR_Chr01g0029491 [Helianthus annuus]|nr:hypothetical protein HanIR_Chr01g0029491 [Helianthus annuus]